MTLSDDFPWVKERAECSLSKVFETLRQQVKGDMDARQAMRSPMFPGNQTPQWSYGFSFHETSDSFMVTLRGINELEECVVFARSERSILIKNTERKVVLEATPSLDANCNCVLLIDKEERPFWYVRKLALEHL